MLVDKIIWTGFHYLNTPYVFNAPAGRTDMFDCSSFIQHIFNMNGISLPRNSRQQFLIGKSVPFYDIQKGDLIFFTTSTRRFKFGLNRIGHVALYIGNNQILHTYKKGGKVTVSNLNKYWISKHMGAKRIIF